MGSRNSISRSDNIYYKDILQIICTGTINIDNVIDKLRERVIPRNCFLAFRAVLRIRFSIEIMTLLVQLYMSEFGLNMESACEEIYRERLPGNNAITASGIASNGKLYYSTEQGYVFIVKAGKDFEVIAKNSMNDIIMATPAISENTLYWRTQHYLVAVGK